MSSSSPKLPPTVTLNHIATLEDKKFMAFDATQLLNQTLKVFPDHREGTIKLPLYDVAIFLKSQHTDYGSLILSNLEHDSKRVEWLINSSHRLIINSTNISSNVNKYLVDGKETEIPLFYYRGIYETIVGVGTPPQRSVLVVDTASDLVWWDCKPCKNCPTSSFDPSKSSSFQQVNCEEKKTDCPRLAGFWCDVKYRDRCKFSISYFDGTEAEGFVAYERMSYNSGPLVERLKFGCAVTGPDSFTGKDYTGILGFDRTQLSFISQFKATSFSFCCRPFTSRVSSPLYLNEIINPGPTTLVVPIFLPNEPSYSIKLMGLYVGSGYVKVDEKLDPKSWVKAIVDSGARITRFPPRMYDRFRDTFREQLPVPYPQVPGIANLDTCYNLSTFNMTSSLELPLVVFDFQGKPAAHLVLSLDAQQIMIPMNHHGIYCLAFAPMSQALDFSIIGSFKLMKIRVTIDLLNNNMLFDRSDCV